ncbi:hypothetical protein [Anaerobacillus alkalilacustris]|nr:hypothetical protein [Anaerobacillus alkalilacustris]
MTVASQVKQTLAGLKSAQQTQMIVDTLAPRVQEIEQEEPQYKN